LGREAAPESGVVAKRGCVVQLRNHNQEAQLLLELAEASVCMTWWRCCVRRRPVRQDRWRLIVRHLLRVRRLQRFFGYVGQRLGDYPASLRSRLREVWPAPGSTEAAREYRRQVLDTHVHSASRFGEDPNEPGEDPSGEPRWTARRPAPPWKARGGRVTVGAPP
jgi:hypothetical protein